MANQLKADGLEIDTEALTLGVNDVLAGNEPALSFEDKEKVVEEIQKLSSAQDDAEKECCSGNGCC